MAWTRVVWGCVAIMGSSLPCLAAPTRFVLQPGSVQVRFRAYGFGLMPIEGQFTRFHGALTLDSTDPQACVVTMAAETASLDMGSRLMTQDAQGPELLDVTAFPDFKVEGRCVDGRLQATLLLHGISKPIVMEVTRGNGTWTAAGMMRRAEWGMGARPLVAGPEVRISMVAGLPAGFAAGAPVKAGPQG